MVTKKDANNEEINLADAFIAKAKDPNLPKGFTWDHFFDEYNVPQRARNDFAIANILRQVKIRMSSKTPKTSKEDVII